MLRRKLTAVVAALATQTACSASSDPTDAGAFDASVTDAGASSDGGASDAGSADGGAVDGGVADNSDFFFFFQ